MWLNLAPPDEAVGVISFIACQGKARRQGRGKESGMDAVSKIKVASPGADVDFVQGDIGKYA
eukprot:scaffold2818_cov146-Alexandrium_tamarense.AAC.4